ncbi:MAG TPA: hypothetical protein VFI59_01285 [Actinomycetota bacterium]|nr:hypothetical protein [Actinomycetota bacterium]
MGERSVLPGRADESLIGAEMQAMEYQQAAWVAHDRDVPPPDASVLSTASFEVIERYGDLDLPRAAQKAVAAEARRRSRLHRDGVTDALAWVALLLPALAGVVTMGVLLAP